MTGDREKDKLNLKRIFKTGTKEEIRVALMSYFKLYKGDQIKPSKYDFLTADLDGKLPLVS